MGLRILGVEERRSLVEGPWPWVVDIWGLACKVLAVQPYWRTAHDRKASVMIKNWCSEGFTKVR